MKAWTCYFLQQQKIASRVKTVKNVAKAAGVGGLGYEATQNVLGGSQ